MVLVTLPRDCLNRRYRLLLAGGGNAGSQSPLKMHEDNMTTTSSSSPVHRKKPIRALASCIPPEDRPARIVYDAALLSPLQVHNAAGTHLSASVQETTMQRISGINASLLPFSISYLHAQVPPRLDQQANIDPSRLSALPRLLFAYASAQEDLQDLDLNLFPRLAVSRGGRGSADLDTSLDVLADRFGGDAAAQAALQSLGAWSTRLWAQAVMSTIGPWAIASGLLEMRLQGKIRPDRRRQLSVLAGGPVPTVPAH